MSSSKMEFKILSIDGGGIRGVFAAKYLAELQNQVDKPLREYFDLITGTSTGGIIAIGLGIGLRPSEILELYERRGDEIFKKLGWYDRHIRRFLEPQYDISSLTGILKEIFGWAKVGDSQVRLCIPVVDNSTGQIKVLKTDHHPTLFTDYKMYAWEAAASTAAAPFYFSSIVLANGSSLIDGGLWANNPSLVGMCEAIRNFKKLPNDISLLSIGTGEEFLLTEKVEKLQLGKLRGAGIKRIVKLAFSAQSQAVERMVEYLGPGKYKRINVVLPKGFQLDDVSKIGVLKTFAEQKAQETISTIKEKFFKKTVKPFIPEHKKKGVRGK